MRVKFHQNLDELKEKLLIMAGMAEQAILVMGKAADVCVTKAPPLDPRLPETY